MNSTPGSYMGLQDTDTDASMTMATGLMPSRPASRRSLLGAYYNRLEG